MSVADYNTDPDSNTSISGINIAEGCPPSGINNAIRQMMADIKDKADSTDTAITTLDGAAVKLSGNQTVGGSKTFDSAIIRSSTTTNPTLKTASNANATRIWGSAESAKGASLTLVGDDFTGTSAGQAYLTTGNDANNTRRSLVAAPDGSLTWDGKDIAIDENVVHKTGDETVGGVKTLSNSIVATSTTTQPTMRGNASTTVLRFWGGNTTDSAKLTLCGKDFSSSKGWFFVTAVDGVNSAQIIGKPDGTLTWDGQPIQTSSDERLKTPLADVPDDVLDAWGAVEWGQFQYFDAVEAKGADKARLHLGLIAQRVKAAFEERGLDACAYGILCHEERPATDEEPAVDLWMVRYTEAAAMEAAFQRRRADRAEARITALERRLDEMETVFATLGA